MSSATIISLLSVVVIALFTSVTAPLLIAHRTEKMHKEDREADWARQDKVAKAASDAADRLLEGQREVAAQAAEAARLLQEKQEEAASAAEKARTDLITSQRLIAAQAAQAAQLLVSAQAETIRRSDEVAALAAERDGLVTKKLDLIDAQAKRIHTLVNSDMTAARQDQRDQANETIIVLKRVIDLASARGMEPDVRDTEALAAAEKSVTELDAILADRLSQQRVVEAEAAKPGAPDLDADNGADRSGETGV